MFDHVLIDTNNLFHRSYAVVSHNQDIEAKEVYKATVALSLKSIRKIEREKTFNDGKSTIWCLFDNPTSKINRRSEMSSEYKAHRKRYEPAFYKAIDLLQNILLSYKDNYRISYIDYLEADDIVKLIIDKVIPEAETILVVSADLDWSRCLSQTRPISWFNFNEVVNSTIFQLTKGYPANENSITLYKSLTGDKSDGISPGVLGIQKKDVIRICNDFQDVNDLLFNNHKADYLTEHMQKKILSCTTKLKQNWQLIKFMEIDLTKKGTLEYIYTCKYKPNSLRILLKSIGFEGFDHRVKKKREGSLFKQQKLPRKK